MAAKKARENKLDLFIDNQYRTLSTGVKVFVAIVAIALPLAAMYFMLYKPNTETKEKLEQDIASVQKEIDRALAKIAKWPEFKAEVEEVRRQYEETLVLLPKEQEIPDLLRNISDLGKAAGLEFTSFAPGNEVRRDFYADIPIAIQIHGPYHSVGSFLDKLSKLERIVTLDSLQMGTPRLENGEMLLTSKGKLLTYRFIDPKPSSPAQPGKK